VLETAKTPQTNGFLVKAFREKDLLTMLDIVRQKHQSNVDLFEQGELIWKKQSESIIVARLKSLVCPLVLYITE